MTQKRDVYFQSFQQMNLGNYDVVFMNFQFKNQF